MKREKNHKRRPIRCPVCVDQQPRGYFQLPPCQAAVCARDTVCGEASTWPPAPVALMVGVWDSIPTAYFYFKPQSQQHIHNMHWILLWFICSTCYIVNHPISIQINNTIQTASPFQNKLKSWYTNCSHFTHGWTIWPKNDTVKFSDISTITIFITIFYTRKIMFRQKNQQTGVRGRSRALVHTVRLLYNMHNSH